MKISGLLPLLIETPVLKRLMTSITGKLKYSINLSIVESAKACFLSALTEHIHLPLLIICAQPDKAGKLYEELQLWCSSSVKPYFFPEHEFLSGDFVYDEHTTAQRLQALSVLLNYTSCKDGNVVPVIVCPAAAAVSYTIAPGDLSANSHNLQIGFTVDPVLLINQWHETGYEMEEVVEVPGTMAKRGGIIDVYSPHQDLPVRIEFFGTKIESIRYFDPVTQRSLRQIDSITIFPAKENSSRFTTGTVLDYCSPDVLVVTDDNSELEEVITRINNQYYEYMDKGKWGISSESTKKQVYADWPQFFERLSKVHKILRFQRTNIADGGNASVEVLPFGIPDDYAGRLQKFIQETAELLQKQCTIVIVSQQTGRLKELLSENDIPVQSLEYLLNLPPKGTVTLIKGSLDEGWSIDNKLVILTDREIFGLLKQRRLLKKRPARRYKYASELSEGDYVVHIDHGIGRFKGLNRMEVGGVEREFITLEYAEGDRLFVPVEQINRVGHYIGGTAQLPRLSRLHTQEWHNAKQRVKRSVIDIAEELVKLYASRELIPGFKFSKDNIWQQELESSFPYIETPDQMRAVIAVKEDMENSKPMDRLVCGDVGYGKTEVALRAAFKAVMDNKQVALLVPTTVLAQQHYYTFTQRLQAFPVRVEVLSRLTTEGEQKVIIEDLSKGAVDICIGTHRLLQKDVQFKDMGLLIIDEEQRFGVAHKDYFKKLRNEVDIITLSATPIPRTLHMALTGIRDLSTMDTPPEDRLPIKTYVGFRDKILLREAILRELERNGQVFYVHNRIHNIFMVAAELRELVPEARVSVAHGRMPDELEQVMSEFVQRKSDILLTTTIIESGLDMPNVNTLIVNDADKLGLTQLYQLRGRIGRGTNTAYAYFFYPWNKKLTTQARKRLETITEATELGAGFKIAMKDLEIRGAGNLLGVDQSGNISIVGFDLYCSLLAEAVEELRRGLMDEKKVEVPALPQPSITLPLDAYIPDSYIQETNIRLSYYRRLAAIADLADIENIRTEFIDRFGNLPVQIEHLLYVIRIRVLAEQCSIEQISTTDGLITLYYHRMLISDYCSDEQKSLLNNRGIKAGRKQIKLDLRQLGGLWQDMLEKVLLAYRNDNQGLIVDR